VTVITMNIYMNGWIDWSRSKVKNWYLTVTLTSLMIGIGISWSSSWSRCSGL